MRSFPPLCAAIALALAAEAEPIRAEPHKESRTARIASLIRQLGHDEFDKREEATKELKAIGVPALDPLQRAEASSDDLEIRRRARQVIREIAAEWQGTWECVADHADGKLGIRNPPYTSRWSFEGLAVIGQTNGDETVTQSGKLTILEAGEKHYKVNYDITDGDGKGETLVGIADFREGQLRFSFRTASSRAGRPDGFVSKAGDKVMVYVFQRPK